MAGRAARGGCVSRACASSRTTTCSPSSGRPGCAFSDGSTLSGAGSPLRRPEDHLGRRHAAPIAGAVDPVEDAGPRPRRGPRVSGDARAPGGDTVLGPGAGGPFATGPARSTRDRPARLLQVARAALGPREPRRPGLPERRRKPPSDPRPAAPALARPELLPRVRDADRGRGLPRPRRSRHAGPLPALRVAAGERPVLDRDARDRGRAGGDPGRAPASLAMAGRRLELRPGSRRGHLVLHGNAAADARPGGVRAWPQARRRAEGRQASRRGVPAPTPLQARLGWARHPPRVVTLHYPLCWHYDVLGGLKGKARIGTIRDPRCA